jgi:transcriptional regulator with XRE-family HTH domain
MADEDAARNLNVGRQVARWRQRRGLTRQQFADLCGRSPSWVDKIERGERALLRLPMLERVAEVLNIPVDVLTNSVQARVAASTCLDAFEVVAIREALQRYDAITTVLRSPVSPDNPADMDRVRQQVTYAWSSFQNAHYSMLGRVLPGLLREAQDAVAQHSGDERESARVLLSEAYEVTASALWKMKEIDLAWLAAERALVLAEAIGDPLLISDAARRVAQGLMATNHSDQALSLLRADIDRLEPGVGTASPEYLSLYGMLFLLGGVVAARQGQATIARELHNEGQVVAGRLGDDRNERWTAFGPTNVVLHQVAALVDLGDGGAAVQAAGGVRPDGLATLPRERRANFFVDVARGHALEGKRDQAVTALLQAEQFAPDEVRCRPLALGLITDLQRQGSGKPPLSLRQLAARVGLGAAS